MSTLKVDQIQGSTGTTVTIPSGTTIVNSGTATNFGISDTNANVSSLVKQWGNLKLSSDNFQEKVGYFFYECNNLDITTKDPLNLDGLNVLLKEKLASTKEG